MNLYTHRDSNIRKTWLLFTAFFVIVIVLGWVFSQAFGNSGILVFAVFFSVLMSFISYWYSDKIVLTMARASPIADNDPRSPDLYNIVENLAITAGLPMPKIYLINDPAPNAFATGRNPEHAVIAVTSGLLEQLEKSELEGVLAHEISHIGNRDMLLSTVIVVLVGFVSLISDWFMRSMWWRGSRNDREGNAGGALVLVGIALALLSPFIATLMQLAISRKREFLADASGALLTRYPQGLASALRKIADDPHRLHSANNTTAHLYIENPFKADSGSKTSWLAKLFMTHPPIEERIKALEDLRI